eukprot:2672470-Pleurochrysis_carterae.AAC.2
MPHSKSSCGLRMRAAETKKISMAYATHTVQRTSNIETNGLCTHSLNRLNIGLQYSVVQSLVVGERSRDRNKRRAWKHQQYHAVMKNSPCP